MIDIQNIEWENFQLGKSGKAVKLLYNKEPVQFCTSSLYTPFGVKSVSKDWSKFDEYNVDCSFNQSTSETSIMFKEFVEKLDKKIKELVEKNGEMFGAKDEFKFEYNNIIKENGNYPKLIKLQLTRDKNGNFESFLFDAEKQKIKINEGNVEEVLKKGKIFKCIIECSKIWYYKEKVGSIWNIVQLKFADTKMVTQNNSNVYNTLMIDD
jgi:hypothetical protein